jgi:hypothetical protein
MCTRFWWASQKEREHLKDHGVDGKMGSELILGRLAAGVDWIQLAQDRDQWWAPVNTVMPAGSGDTELVIIIYPSINDT